MKSPKSPPKNFPTTTDLRAKDLTVLRAEIAHFITEITNKTGRNPHKAAIILGEWLNTESPSSSAKKSAA